MSVDLSRLYETLGEVADTAALPGVDTIRARVRRRRARTAGVALSALVVLVLLAGTAVWLLPRVQSAVPPEIDPPSTFLPFDPSAKPVLAVESGYDFGYAISRPGRAYVMWLDSSRDQRVVAIDTTTGRPLWQPTVLGRFGDTNGMMVSRDAILMLTEQRFLNDGSDRVGSDRLIAVDPAGGKVMWELDYGFNDTDRELYDDVLVIGWQEQGRIEALDLKTGRARWTVNERAISGGINALRTHEDYRFTGFLAGPLPPRDRRVVLQLADGRVQVREVDTGRLVSERSGAGLQVAPDGYAIPTVTDDKIYAADQRGLVEIAVTGDSPPRVVYQPSGRVDGPVVPCGPGLLCLLESRRDSVATELVLVDTVVGRQRWRQPVDEHVRAVSPSGSGVLLAGGKSVLYDLAGHEVWSSADSLAGWVDSGNLLVFGPLGVSGHSLASGRTTVLGGGTPQYCAWDATHVTCPGPQGVFSWRYRN